MIAGALCVKSVQLTEGIKLVDLKEGGIWSMKVPKMLGALTETELKQAKSAKRKHKFYDIISSKAV